MEYTIYPFRYIPPSEGWAAFLDIAFNIVKNMERPNENKKKINSFLFGQFRKNAILKSIK